MSGFAEYQPRAHGSRTAVLVRPATGPDVDAIEDIQHRSGRTGHPDAYRRAIAAPDVCVLVAVTTADDPPVVVGWAQTHHRTLATDPAPVGHYLGGVTVDPRWRRRGVAAALTQARLDWVAERAPQVHYVVNVRNLASIALHRPWSFEEVARGARLAGATFEGGVGLLMRAELPTAAATACAR